MNPTECPIIQSMCNTAELRARRASVPWPTFLVLFLGLCGCLGYLASVAHDLNARLTALEAQTKELREIAP